MTSLAAGDTVTQPAVQFDEPLESSDAGESIDARTWSDDLSGSSGSPLFNAAFAFSGLLNDGTFTANNNETITWDISQYQFAGTLTVYVQADMNTGKFVNGVSISSEISDSEGRITFDVALGDTSIGVQHIQTSNRTYIYGFALNGFLIIDGEP